MPSPKQQPAPLVFPKKGEAQPPADAVGRTAQAAAADPVPAANEPGAAARKPDGRAPGQQADALLSAAAAMLDGADDLVQINVTVPRRVRNQLHILKLTGQATSIKAVTTDAVTKAVEALLAGAGDAGKGRAGP